MRSSGPTGSQTCRVREQRLTGRETEWKSWKSTTCRRKVLFPPWGLISWSSSCPGSSAHCPASHLLTLASPQGLPFPSYLYPEVLPSVLGQPPQHPLLPRPTEQPLGSFSPPGVLFCSLAWGKWGGWAALSSPFSWPHWPWLFGFLCCCPSEAWPLTQSATRLPQPTGLGNGRWAFPDCLA